MSSQPQKIGMYEVMDTISVGPMHRVYRVQFPGGRPMALKTAIREHLSSQEIKSFEREARVCGELDHRNLVQVFDYGEDDGILYQAMDLLEGADLRSLLAGGRQFTWLEKTSIMQQVCEGMEYAHRGGFIHRDLQPEHIFVEESGRIRVLDFSTVGEEDSSGTTLNARGMSQLYCAPEVIQGEPYTTASDVFSMGVIFYELCTGWHPFRQGKETLAVTIDAIMRKTPQSLMQVDADAPRYLDTVIQDALKKTPASRPPDAGALRLIMAQRSIEDRR